MLERIGLDPATTAVYRARLLDPDLGVEELAARLQMAPDEVATSTQRLVSLGLAVSLPADSGVRPVSPDVGLDLLIAAQEEELRRQENALHRLRSEASAFMEDYRQQRDRRSATQLETLDGPGRVQTRLTELISRTRDERLTLVSHRPGADALAADRRVTEDLLERGVSLRSVYLASSLNEQVVQDHLAWLVERGGGVRTTPSVPVWVSIHDRETALVATEPSQLEDSAVLLTSPGAVSALVSLFELHWRDGEAALGHTRRQSAQPRPAELELLALLLAGHTDESSARHLQVSARTIRRMLTELQRKADASSRFELAARAVSLGWLQVE